MNDYVMTEQRAKEAAERILKEMDKHTLFGASLDCMSDSEKIKFQSTLQKIVRGL